MITVQELARLYELQLRSTAAHYDLKSPRQRAGSAARLVELFFKATWVLQPDTFIEAGAKTGETSLRARETCPKARIVAFEANPFNYEKYSATFRHEQRKVDYINAALSDQPGPVTFNIVTARCGASVDRVTGINSILERVDATVEYEPVTVDATTIDIHFQAPGRTIMWVDVEGASRQVLTGANRTLATTDVILVELEDKAAWKGQWSASEAIVHLMQRGFVPVARDFEFRTQHNVLFLSDQALAHPEIKATLESYFSELGGQRNDTEDWLTENHYFETSAK